MLPDDVPGRRGYYIVQFDGPIEGTWKAALAAAGADVLDYIPDFALKVRMNPAAARQIAGIANVAWVGPFQPAYKIAPEVAAGSQPGAYVVRVEAGADVPQAEAAVAATGARVVDRDGALLTIVATAAELDQVAHVLDVASIEPFALRHKHNEFGGGSIMRGEMVAALGYDGSTQAIAITDTGLGGGSAADAHRDLPPGRVAGIFNWPGAPSFCFETIIGDGPIDVDTGHGTHVASSAVGGGDANGAGRGTAPESRLVFQAIEDFAVPSLFCQLLLGLQPGYYLAGIPADIGTLFQQGYDAGARVHSNSWGSAANGAYTADAVNVDAFVWTHRDLAVTISAGNSGIDANADGVVDDGSLMSPATAKNVISVGASEGDRRADYACDAGVPNSCAARGGQNDVFTYGEAFGSSFPANPLRDDPSAGQAEQMAAFSSRGPTTDGRIKPDVVAPGTWILSGYSDQFQRYYDPAPNPQNGLYQYDGWGDPPNDKYKYMGGTSMSAPLVAGAAAVVRDFYAKAHAHDASAALVKATLVNSAVDLLDENNDGADDNAYPIPNSHEGWGRVDMVAATDLTRQFIDESAALTTGSTASFTFAVGDSIRPFKVTLAWTDAPSSPSAARHLVNDLDLELIAPDGQIYAGNSFADGWSFAGGPADRLNNLENVFVAAPPAGEWTVVVRAFNVPQGPQSFALVMGLSDPPPPVLPRVSVSASVATVNEIGSAPATFTLTRTGELSGELRVDYMVSGSAAPGTDYDRLSGEAIFAPSASEATVLVAGKDDEEVEGDETVILTVVAGDGYGVRLPVSATVTIVSDDQPGDLIVSAASAPGSAAAGASIVVSNAVRNQGSWPVQGAETGFYLSTNSSLDGNDVFLGARAVPLLPPFVTDTQATTLQLPVDVAGPHYIIAKADWNGRVIEVSENNNTRNTTLIRVGPDLVVATVSIPPTASPGTAILVSDTTRNDGPQAAPASTTAFFLSTNSSISTSDVQLGSRSVPALSSGASHTATTSVVIPAAVAAGTYYVIARADDELAVGEGNESNNTRYAASLKIGADLDVSTISGAATAAPGGSFAVNDTTRNQGGAAAGESLTAYYLSPNSSLGSGDIRIGERLIPALGAGLTSSAASLVTIPEITAPGMYYLLAQADANQAVVESAETNNVRAATTRVKVGPDLVVSDVDGPTLGGAGTTLTITDRLSNIGGAASAATEAVLYLSSNTALDAGDVEIARRPVAPIAPGGVDTVALAASIPEDTAPGSYYVIEVVDSSNSVVEAMETNNTSRTSIVRIGPDLTVSALSASSGVAGGTLTIADTTRNGGGGNAAGSVTAFYLSPDSALDSADVRIGSRAVPALTAGISNASTTVLTLPAAVPAGSYYLFAVADETSEVAETFDNNNTRRVYIKIAAP
jgi:subtilase family serine protease